MVAGFDGGTITSDSGALLLGQLDPVFAVLVCKKGIAAMSARPAWMPRFHASRTVSPKCEGASFDASNTGRAVLKIAMSKTSFGIASDPSIG